MRQTTTVLGMELRHIFAVFAGAGLIWLAIELPTEIGAAIALLVGGVAFLWGISRLA